MAQNGDSVLATFGGVAGAAVGGLVANDIATVQGLSDSQALKAMAGGALAGGLITCLAPVPVTTALFAAAGAYVGYRHASQNQTP